MIPDGSSANIKQEIKEYEDSNSKILERNVLITKTTNPLGLKKLNTFEQELSPDCRDQIIDLKRMDVSDIEEKFKEVGVLISSSCALELEGKEKLRHIEVLNDVCNFPQKVEMVTSKLDKVLDKKPIKKNKEHEIKVKNLHAMCELGGLMYRSEVNNCLDKNLMKIDKFSRYYYLKLMDGIKNEKLSSTMTNKMMRSLPYLESVIRLSMRFIFVGHVMKEIHEKELTLEELRFEDSPIRSALLKIINKLEDDKTSEE
jgi:hypothetical protein